MLSEYDGVTITLINDTFSKDSKYKWNTITTHTSRT